MFAMKIRWFLAITFCALILSFFAPAAYRKWRSAAFYGASLADNTVTTTELPPAYIRSLRPTYPYSVIPGGAYSPQELRSANNKDNIVRAHYADFDMKDAWVVKLTADRYQYVSYRMQDQVYWTAKKLRIPKGEYLLTDGIHFARARCGNRLSEQPHEQISSMEPLAPLLSQPNFQPNLTSKLDLGQTPPLSSEVQVPVDPSTGLTPFLSPNTAGPVLLERSPELLAGNPSVPVGPLPIVIGTLGGTPTASSPSDPGGTPNEPPVPPVGPSPVPEPASIYLFLIVFVIALWALTRVLAAEKKRDAD
jgi:hypothetical protein